MLSSNMAIQVPPSPSDWATTFDFPGHLKRFIEFLAMCSDETNMAKYRSCIMAALENDDCHYYEMAIAITYEPTKVKQKGRILKGTEPCVIRGDYNKWRTPTINLLRQLSTQICLFLMSEIVLPEPLDEGQATPSRINATRSKLTLPKPAPGKATPGQETPGQPTPAVIPPTPGNAIQGQPTPVKTPSTPRNATPGQETPGQPTPAVIPPTPGNAIQGQPTPVKTPSTPRNATPRQETPGLPTPGNAIPGQPTPVGTPGQETPALPTPRNAISGQPMPVETTPTPEKLQLEEVQSMCVLLGTKQIYFLTANEYRVTKLFNSSEIQESIFKNEWGKKIQSKLKPWDKWDKRTKAYAEILRKEHPIKFETIDLTWEERKLSNSSVDTILKKCGSSERDKVFVYLVRITAQGTIKTWIKKRHAEEFLTDIAECIMMKYTGSEHPLEFSIAGTKRPCIGCCGRMTGVIDFFNQHRPGRLWLHTIQNQPKDVQKRTLRVLLTKSSYGTDSSLDTDDEDDDGKELRGQRNGGSNVSHLAMNFGKMNLS